MHGQRLRFHHRLGDLRTKLQVLQPMAGVADTPLVSAPTGNA